MSKSRKGDKRNCGLSLTPSEWRNYSVHVDYLKRLQELAIGMFEWKNLPDTVDERFLELTLFTHGFAVFFKDEIADFYLALECMIGGPLDVYRVPKQRRAYAVNGYNHTLTDRDSVLVFNNYLREPSYPTIKLYADRLADLERTLEVNIRAQKTPVLLLGTEAQRLTLKNLYAQYDGNEPFIFGDKGHQEMFQNFTVLKTDAPFVADKLMTLKHQVWNEALTYLGIENSNQDKKERLITDEVTSNLGAVEAQRYARLNARRQACEKINRLFGLDIWVDFRTDFNTTDGVSGTSTTEPDPEPAEEVADVE